MKILVLHSPKGYKIAKRLQEIWCRKNTLSTLLVSALLIEESNDFLICSPYITHVCAENMLTVVPDDLTSIPETISSEIILVSSKITSKISGQTVITYGQHDKDTITFSSIGREQAVISLQREIVTLAGEISEPCEIVVAKSEYTDTDFALAIVGICIITGNTELLGEISL